MTVKFTIDGEPVGKQRPRASSFGGHTRMYTPKKTVGYEQLVALEYERQCNYFFACPVGVKISIYKRVQKGDSKKMSNRKLAGEVLPTVKPDVDNVAKSILDALNKVAYPDDGHVVKLEVIKVYSIRDRVDVEITGYGLE